MNKLSLPRPVAAYFNADRLGGDAVARCFTEDGTVTDEGQTYVGGEAIAAWKNAASARFTYSTEPVDIDQSGENPVVKGRVTGNFPGSPVLLRYTFFIDQDRITSLEIVP